MKFNLLIFVLLPFYLIADGIDPIGQLFIGIVYDQELSEDSKLMLKKTGLGNVILFRWNNGLENRAQIRKLIREIKSEIYDNTHIEPLIAIDQEGGSVNRLVGEEFTFHPSNAFLAVHANPEYAYELARRIGFDMQEMGICWNLAPVVDLDQSGIINQRSFGSDPVTVSTFASAMIRGFHSSGILTTLKHFPGHGAAIIDSHVGLPVITKPLEKLEQEDFFPFKSLAPATDAIMTAHVKIPAIDPDYCATLSKILLTDMLRTAWGFEGVIISDSLAMRAVSPHQSTLEETVESMTEAAIEAFLAGCDCLLISKPEWAETQTTPQQDLYLIERVIAGFRKAVDSGRIPQKRVQESFERIIKMKSNTIFGKRYA